MRLMLVTTVQTAGDAVETTVIIHIGRRGREASPLFSLPSFPAVFLFFRSLFADCSAVARRAGRTGAGGRGGRGGRDRTRRGRRKARARARPKARRRPCLALPARLG